MIESKIFNPVGPRHSLVKKCNSLHILSKEHLSSTEDNPCYPAEIPVVERSPRFTRVFAPGSGYGNRALSFVDYGRYFPRERAFLRILCFIDTVNIIPALKV
jgi:hypothetical protein